MSNETISWEARQEARLGSLARQAIFGAANADKVQVFAQADGSNQHIVGGRTNFGDTVFVSLEIDKPGSEPVDTHPEWQVHIFDQDGALVDALSVGSDIPGIAAARPNPQRSSSVAYAANAVEGAVWDPLEPALFNALQTQATGTLIARALGK